MNRKEAYKIIRNNRFIKQKKIMLRFRRSDNKKVIFSATTRRFFVEEDLVRKIIKELTQKTKVKK